MLQYCNNYFVDLYDVFLLQEKELRLCLQKELCSTRAELDARKEEEQATARKPQLLLEEIKRQQQQASSDAQCVSQYSGTPLQRRPLEQNHSGHYRGVAFIEEYIW